MADELTSLYARLPRAERPLLRPAAADRAERTELYFTELLPTFDEIKREADEVLDLNQRNMEDENDRARDGRGRGRSG